MQATESTVDVRRHRWTLHSPAHFAEVEKAIAVAQQRQEALRTKRQTPGDIYIRAEGDQIVIGFECERPQQPVRATKGLMSDA